MNKIDELIKNRDELNKEIKMEQHKEQDKEEEKKHNSKISKIIDCGFSEEQAEYLLGIERKINCLINNSHNHQERIK